MMHDFSELYGIVEHALYDNIKASVWRGLGNLPHKVGNDEYLADRVANAARDSGAIGEMFDRYVRSWILSNRGKVEKILEEAEEADE